MKGKFLLGALAVLLATGFASAQASAGFTKIGTATTTTFSDSGTLGCPLQSTCYYQVTSVDANGFESSPAACAATQLCVSGNTAAAIMPSSGTHSVTVNWVASPTTGVTYNVYRHTGPLPGSGVSTTVN
jgi:hypothetical protein